MTVVEPEATEQDERPAARAIGRDLWDTFFAEPVSGTAIRSAGGATAVTTATIGLVAFVLATVGVALAPRFAGIAAGPDAILSNDTEPGLPVTVPDWFYAAFVALLFASALVGYFGAVHAPRRLAALAVGLLTCGTIGFAGSAWSFRDETWLGWIGLPAVALAPVVVVVLRARPRSAPVTQVVALVLACLTVAVPSLALMDFALQPGLAGGSRVLNSLAEQAVFLLAFLVSPAAVLAGTGAVSFGLQVTAFLGRSIDRAGGRRVVVLVVVLLALLVWRLGVAVVDLAGDDHLAKTLVRTAAIGVLIAVVTAWWAWATRGADETEDDVDGGAAAGSPVVVLLLLGSLLLPGILLLLGLLEVSVVKRTTVTELATRVSSWLAQGDRLLTYQLTGAVLLLVGAAWAARRRPGPTPAFVGVAGLTLLAAVGWVRGTDGRGWGVIDTSTIALFSLLLVTAATATAAVRWVRTRRLPAERTVLVAFVALVLGELLAHSSFLDDPFQPLLGFTGIGLVLFGVVWSLLTVASNEDDSPPQAMGRALVLISYAVFTTGLIAWTTSVGSTTISSTGDSAGAFGQQILGGALFAALLGVWVPQLFRRADAPSAPDA